MQKVLHQKCLKNKNNKIKSKKNGKIKTPLSWSFMIVDLNDCFKLDSNFLEHCIDKVDECWRDDCQNCDIKF